MLNRYSKWDGYRSIPFTRNKFLISVNGDIIDTENGIKLRSDRNDKIQIFDGNIFRNIQRSVLVAIVSKCSKIPLIYWELLKTIPLDDNEDNVHASNLIWRFPLDGLRVSSFTDFSYIPGFSRYSINKEGILYSHVSNKNLSPYQDVEGYWMYGCQPDVGSRTIIGRHRLLALAFLEYPKNVDNLDVNHIDGVKPNCVLSNLEWSTRKNNCDHAYSTGLRTDNVEVSVMNSFTGEIQDFYSFEDCARKLNVDGETIRLRVQSAGQTIYKPGLQFKKKSDESTWKKFENPVSELLRSGVPRELTLQDRMTGDKKSFSSIIECAKFLNISSSGLGWRLKNNPSKPIGNFVIL